MLAGALLERRLATRNCRPRPRSWPIATTLSMRVCYLMSRGDRMEQATNIAGQSRDLRRRTLSQNLLRDAGVVDQLVKAAQLSPTDTVVEIGAGDGIITSRLAASAGHVIAYELDPHYARELRKRFRDRPSVEIVEQDVLRSRPPVVPFAVVANVPFSITTSAINWMLNAEGFRSATLITQLEFARKRSGDYGRWSKATVATWPRFQWTLVRRIPRHAFRPVPRVDAAILRIRRRPKALVHPFALGAYAEAVEVGFRGKGGSLAASLRNLYPHSAVTRAFQTVGVNLDTVVGYVSADQWVQIFKELRAARSG